jgi:hypothetical protein
MGPRAAAAGERDEAPIPKVRPGTYLPSLLQSRRRAEHALLAVVQEAYEWAVAERRYFSAESMKQLTAPALPATAQEIFAAIG